MLLQQALGNAGPLVGRLGYGATVLEGNYRAGEMRKSIKSPVQVWLREPLSFDALWQSSGGASGAGSAR